MNGFFISSTASVVGSAIAFVVLRAVLKKRLQQLSSSNEKWGALESVVVSPWSALFSRAKSRFVGQKAKGLPLIILVRVSPFPPWVYSNALFAVSFRAPGVASWLIHRVLP